ncbi:MAG: type II toxin-antitoxin system VapC family toxin [Candidatus Acidiferrales bacterium]
MKILLDTHIWIWSLTNAGNLSSAVAAALREKGNEVWLSPLSVWETMILFEKGRIVSEHPSAEWINSALAAAPMKEAPLTTEIVLATREFRETLRDPADTFLAATAKILNLTLATSDLRLMAVEGISILPNR